MTIPNVFVAQTLADAVKVNENFDYLEKWRVNPSRAIDTSTRSRNDVAFADLTGASITITIGGDVVPVIGVTLALMLAGLTDARGAEFQLLRGIDVVAGPFNVADTPSAYRPYTIIFVDQPQTAGAYTYKVQWRNKTAGYAVNCNYSLIARLV